MSTPERALAFFYSYRRALGEDLPLAQDTLAIARGKVSPAARQRPAPGPEVTVAQCPQCGGALHYEPGTVKVECPYCGHQLGLREADLAEAPAPLVSTLRLQRRCQGQVWEAVERIVRCQACRAELAMTHHLARQCAYCGSTNVLLVDNGRTLEQPDGFLPFKLIEREAAEAIRRARHSGPPESRRWWRGKGQRPDGQSGGGLALPEGQG